MDADAGNFADWEILTDSDDSAIVNSSDSAENYSELDVIERDSGGIIRVDYFSVGDAIDVDVGGEGCSIESDNPSWIDPELETGARYVSKDSGGFWTDSSSDRSDDRIVVEFGGNSDSGILEMTSQEVGSDAIGEIGGGSDDSVMLLSDSGCRMEVNGGAVMEGEALFSSEEKVVDELKKEKIPVESDKFAIEAMKSCSDEGKRGMDWWKRSLDLLKYCLFRASPVWSISVAAAMLGAIILGRRLYQMKRKARSLQLKVTTDDKKVSQFMTRAARLNEAFSVVKRVPMIRPSLPAAGGGVATWPMMSLR